MKLAVAKRFQIRFPLQITDRRIMSGLAHKIAANVASMTKEHLRAAFSDGVQQLEHKNESVAIINGVEFINDSKSTSINATWFTLENTDGPIVWLAGGVDKGNDYNDVLDLVKQKVVAIICLGEYDQKIRTAFSAVVPIIETVKSMHQAVSMAYKLARHGNTVLLSPACASFDIFENYEDRGRQFREEVKSL